MQVLEFRVLKSRFTLRVSKWDYNIQICSAYNAVSAGLHFIPFAAVYLLYFRNIFSLVNGLYHPVSRGRIASIVSTILNTHSV